MRTLAISIFLLLVLWISGASYWYVCRVRYDCKCCQPEVVVAPDTTGNPEDQLNASVDEAMNYLKNTGKQTVFFNSSLSVSDMSVLPEEFYVRLKLYLDNNSEAKVTVTGHTDSSGSRAGNTKLSQQRADFVKEHLVATGINPDQIIVISKVDADPVASNDNAEGRAKNRRAEIEI